MERAINFAMKKSGVVELKKGQKECLQRFLEAMMSLGHCQQATENLSYIKISPVALSCPPQYLRKTLVSSLSRYRVKYHRYR